MAFHVYPKPFTILRADALKEVLSPSKSLYLLSITVYVRFGSFVKLIIDPGAIPTIPLGLWIDVSDQSVGARLAAGNIKQSVRLSQLPNLGPFNRAPRHRHTVFGCSRPRVRPRFRVVRRSSGLSVLLALLALALDRPKSRRDRTQVLRTHVSQLHAIRFHQGLVDKPQPPTILRGQADRIAPLHPTIARSLILPNRPI